MKKVMIFIDGSNLYYGMVDNFGENIRIDFEKFIECLLKYEQERELVRVYYYNVPVDIKDGKDKYESQQRFLSRLAYIPNFEVKLGRLVRRGDKRVEKGVDVKLAVDMLDFAYHNLYDIAILVSGDGDFASVIEKVKNQGKHVENAYFFSGRSFQLQKVCDRFIKLDEEFLKDCLFEKQNWHLK